MPREHKTKDQRGRGWQFWAPAGVMVVELRDRVRALDWATHQSASALVGALALCLFVSQLQCVNTLSDSEPVAYRCSPRAGTLPTPPGRPEYERK